MAGPQPQLRPKSSSIPSHSSPSNLGYRLPAEWESHLGTWLSWPDQSKSAFFADSSSARLSQAQRVFTQIVRALAMVEKVHVNVNNISAERAAIKSLGSAPPNLVFHHFPTDDIHCRDYAAMFVCCRSAQWRTPPLVAIDWGCTAGRASVTAGADGAKDRRAGGQDNVIPMSMARVMEVPCISGGLNLHGGDIDTNGNGILLTTEGCLLTRNPAFQKRQIEQRLFSMLGVTDVVWLADMAGNGHRRVDDLARFVGRDTVVANVASDSLEPSQEALQQNLRRLSAIRVDQKQISVVQLPLPASKGVTRASYTNFYVANGLVMVPQFGIPSDVLARERLS